MANNKLLKILLVLIIVFIVFELSTYFYVRYHRLDTNAHNENPGKIYITHHYTHALGEFYYLNKALVYIHWPLMKLEGIYRNYQMNALHLYNLITIYKPDHQEE